MCTKQEDIGLAFLVGSLLSSVLFYFLYHTMHEGRSLVLATCSGGGNAISPYHRGFLVPAELFRKRFRNVSETFLFTATNP